MKRKEPTCTWDAGWEALQPSEDTNDYTVIGWQENTPGTGDFIQENGFVKHFCRDKDAVFHIN